MEKNELNIDIGRRIRQTRENMGYTREVFSELCDISDSFLSDVERGNKSLTTKTLHKICSTSHVSADYLLFGTTDDTPVDDPHLDYIVSILSKMNVDQRSHAQTILNEYFLALNNL